MSKALLLSERKYHVVGYEPNGISYEPFKTELCLKDFFRDDNETPEYIFSVQDDVDQLLDLKVGQCIRIRSDRSDANSSMTIKRIK
jgi:hypothetical protein